MVVGKAGSVVGCSMMMDDDETRFFRMICVFVIQHMDNDDTGSVLQLP